MDGCRVLEILRVYGSDALAALPDKCAVGFIACGRISISASELVMASRLEAIPKTATCHAAAPVA